MSRAVLAAAGSQAEETLKRFVGATCGISHIASTRTNEAVRVKIPPSPFMLEQLTATVHADSCYSNLAPAAS